MDKFITRNQQDPYRKTLRATGVCTQRGEWFPNSTAATWTDLGRAALASCLLDHNLRPSPNRGLQIALPLYWHRFVGWFYVWIEDVGLRWRRVVVDSRGNVYIAW